MAERRAQARVRLSADGPVGLLGKLLFFPITGPVAGIRWSLGKVQSVVEEELTDDEYVERESALMARLREVRAWRERLGKGTSGGPVRVAKEAEEE